MLIPRMNRGKSSSEQCSNRLHGIIRISNYTSSWLINTSTQFVDRFHRISLGANSADNRCAPVVVLWASLDVEPAQPLEVSAHTLVIPDVGHLCGRIML